MPSSTEASISISDAIHLAEPSPQRTPVLYQAGASARGRRFAAANAECIFIGAPSQTVLAKFVTATREAIEAAGRPPNDVLIFAEHTAIVANTQSEAEDKLAEYRSYASEEAALALMSDWTGTDLSAYALDDPFEHVQSNAIRTAVEAMSSADPGRVWTIREIASWCGIGGVSPVSVGTPAQVADSLQDWAERTGLDGFNLAHAVTHETFGDVADLLVPELQRRGVFKTAYDPGTLRSKLFARGDRLSGHHPAAGFRFAPEGSRSAPCVHPGCRRQHARAERRQLPLEILDRVDIEFVEFSRFAPDDPVTHIRNDAIHSAVDALTVDDPDRVWTVRELAQESAIGGLGARVVGSPERVVDEMQSWIADTGVDGFNLAYAVTPGTFEDIVEFIVPELQRRGLYKTEYAPGTLREKLFSRGARLSAPHPGAAYRSDAIKRARVAA